MEPCRSEKAGYFQSAKKLQIAIQADILAEINTVTEQLCDVAMSNIRQQFSDSSRTKYSLETIVSNDVQVMTNIWNYWTH